MSLRPRDEPTPSRWERVAVGLEFFGFGVLMLAGLTSAAWGAIRYLVSP